MAAAGGSRESEREVERLKEKKRGVRSTEKEQRGKKKIEEERAADLRSVLL